MAGIKEEKKIYLVGIYCRLSKDDGTDNESASIATQKSILTDYVKKQGWHIAKTYVDDGYSGTNFQRPSFQNMIKDIESGLINCVITKDLSRLGRNYLDCGLYLEVFFPEHNVRYIAVNDGVDTLNKSAMDITPFRNILNEMYAADISVKIKSAYRARFQQGKFMGTTAPYGYIKDPADHNHLLIDDKVAPVVKEIFDLALKGNIAYLHFRSPCSKARLAASSDDMNVLIDKARHQCLALGLNCLYVQFRVISGNPIGNFDHLVPFYEDVLPAHRSRGVYICITY